MSRECPEPKKNGKSQAFKKDRSFSFREQSSIHFLDKRSYLVDQYGMKVNFPSGREDYYNPNLAKVPLRKNNIEDNNVSVNKQTMDVEPVATQNKPAVIEIGDSPIRVAERTQADPVQNAMEVEESKQVKQGLISRQQDQSRSRSRSKPKQARV
eukprot:TRINITY_DN4479_c1_g1_i6.p1 TRINITY_DN4479_c1_g1~~TRINITY_DN4479_c1_g1_i6.p1  ORF type:complete len:154 (-),score=26.31 TRINITY_DN4479_c1_g1_i6:59-520(-)